MSTAGLSIERDRLRVSVMNRRMGRVTQLLAEDHAMPGDEAERKTGLTGVLQKLRKDHGVRSAAVGIELLNFSHHFVKLPVTSGRDIALALPFEMEKYLPLPPAEYIMDHVRVAEGPQESTSLVLAVKRDRLRWIREAFREAGVSLSAIRCSAMVCLSEYASSKPPQKSVLLHREADTRAVFGMSGALPAQLKVFRKGASPAAEAGEMASTFGNAIYSTGATDEPGLEGLGVTGLNYSIAMLIASSGASRGRLNMDFLAREHRPEGINAYPYIIAAMATASVVLFFLTTVMSYYKDSKALAGVRAELAQLKGASNEIMARRKELDAINEKTAFLREFQTNKNVHTRALAELSRVLPADAWLTSLSHDDRGKLEIQGYAERSAEVVGPLEKSKLFRGVKFSSPVSMKDNTERFTISMEVER